jgi:hypothetical protein
VDVLVDHAVRHQLAELAELQQTGVRILRKVVLRERTQLRVDLLQHIAPDDSPCADYLGVHYSTVNRLLARIEMRDCKT